MKLAPWRVFAENSSRQTRAEPVITNSRGPEFISGQEGWHRGRKPLVPVLCRDERFIILFGSVWNS